ncbi:ATP-binding protein [Protofrankia symbiont of Coriaria ruscifolia]|uniref:ATP-binding protein n=1 Tax=Protofrankia symbiont of Coriaria ruscifolia TaxID=1306542 RepID=UPI0013EF7801|nr:ATP-binding protein [Protofrankia symbiont of Coriaria ruscifolia]
MTAMGIAATSSEETLPSSARLSRVWHHPAHLGSVGAARRDATGQIRRWNLDELADTAALVVSELATNAVLASQRTDSHDRNGTPTRRPAGVALRLTYTHHDLIIEMWDQAAGRPVQQVTDLAADNGRGLLLVATLARNWGYYRIRTVGRHIGTGEGKVVWAAIAHDRPPVPAVVTDALVSVGLPRRSPQADGYTSSTDPIAHDHALLQRVIDGLRAFDDWPRRPADR